MIDAAAVLRLRGMQSVAAMGVSEGAAAVIFAGADGARLAAIISDSSYANLEALLKRIPPLDSLNPVFGDTILWELGLMTGRAIRDLAPAQAGVKPRRMPTDGDQRGRRSISPAGAGATDLRRRQRTQRTLDCAPGRTRRRARRRARTIRATRRRVSGQTPRRARAVQIARARLTGCGKSLRSLHPLSYLPPVRGRRLRKEAIFYAGCGTANYAVAHETHFFRTPLRFVPYLLT